MADLSGLLRADVLWVAIIASTLAQFLKPFTFWLRTGEFSWRKIAETGGMPSSHSAMLSALSTGVGLKEGFDSAYFAISMVISLIVFYDAANVRREAGTHARMINFIIAEVLSGKEVDEPVLREVLGHTYREVFGGILFGIGIMVLWLFVLKP